MEVAHDVVSAVDTREEFVNLSQKFTRTTGLPLLLETANSEHRIFDTPFCATGCQDCQQFRSSLLSLPATAPITRSCTRGGMESAIPVPCSEESVWLLTGGYPMDQRRASTPVRIHEKTVTWDRLSIAVAALEGFAPKVALMLEQAKAEHTSIHPAVQRSIEVIHESFAEPLTISEISKLAGLHPDYLSKLFSKTTGKSIRDFLTHFRLENALHLLANPQMRVTEAAFASGFQSISQFNRAFRERYGRSPSNFRHHEN